MMPEINPPPPIGEITASKTLVASSSPKEELPSMTSVAANPEDDWHLSLWQETVGHQIIPDTHKNGCANEATTGLTLGLFVMLLQDVVFG